MLWRSSSSLVNDELYKGYYQGNKETKTNEIAAGSYCLTFPYSTLMIFLADRLLLFLFHFFAAYDFLQSSNRSYSVNIWYNSTLHSPENPVSLRVPRSVNMVCAWFDMFHLASSLISEISDTATILFYYLGVFILLNLKEKLQITSLWRNACSY